MWIASHTVLQVVIFIAVAINCIVLALQVNVNYMYQIPFLVISGVVARGGGGGGANAPPAGHRALKGCNNLFFRYVNHSLGN